MKVLFIVENYYPKMSGVPNVVKYIAENLAKNGNEVTIITRTIENCSNEEFLNSVKIIRKNIGYTKLKTFSGDTKEYIDFVINFECDVMIFECSQCITTDLILPYLNKIKAKKIFHSHGFSGLTLSPIKFDKSIKNMVGNTFNWIRWNKYYKFKFKKYVKEFDATMCLSEIDSSKKYLDKYSKKVYVLSNAADDMFFLNQASKNNIEKYIVLKNKKYFISIANYQEYKNQIGILQQFLKAKTNDYDMVFIGSVKNDYYEKLIREYNKYKKIYKEKSVHFLTGIDRKDIPNILRGATLYLTGSTFEEFSISLIEAMAVGVPYISTNVGNARMLPGGITIDNISQMASNIDLLINKNQMYEELKINGEIYTRKECRIDSVVNKLMDIINGKI